MKKSFTAEHKRRAIALFDNARRAGKTSKEAAMACGHAAETVAGWRDQLSKPAAKPRPCLCCRRQFRSTGSGNRLCRACKQQDSGLPAGWDEAVGGDVA